MFKKKLDIEELSEEIDEIDEELDEPQENEEQIDENDTSENDENSDEESESEDDDNEDQGEHEDEDNLETIVCQEKDDLENIQANEDNAFAQYLQLLAQPAKMKKSKTDISNVIARIIQERKFRIIKKKGKAEALLGKHEILAQQNDLLLCVFFESNPKLGIGRAREICDIIQQLHLSQIIVVIHDKITSAALKFFQDITAPKDAKTETTINILSKAQLSHFYVDHHLVPKHRQLSIDETIAFYKDTKVKPFHIANLPSIDPVCKINGWKPGTLIEIVRTYGGLQEPSKKIRCVDAPSFKPL